MFLWFLIGLGNTESAILIQGFCRFHIKCLGKDGDWIHDGIARRHLYLPLTCLAVGGDIVRIDFLDLLEERRTDLL